MMRHAFATLILPGALVLLVACGPPPAPEIHNPPVQARSGAGGLESREPDTCGLAAVAGLQGQPGAAAASVGLDGPTRIIPLGGIVTQEYNPARVNFYLDADGMIGRISCG